MKRITMTLLTCLLAVSCSREPSQTGVTVNMPVLEKVSTADGKRQGQYMRYSPDGTMEVSCNYLDGKLDGPAIYYYPDGKSISKTATYKDGVLYGRENLYYPDGTLKTTFVNDSGKVSEVTCYYADGTQAFHHSLHSDGIRHDSRYYYESGKLREEIRNTGNISHFVAYYENGNIWKEGSFMDGAMLGTWRFYDESGKLVREIRY